MITRLSLENFKSWKKIADMRLAPVTGLFGANSSGKTAILQFLLMLKQTAESPDRKQVLNFGDERTLVGLGSFQDAIHKHAEAGRLGWSFDWTLREPLKVTGPEDKRAVLLAGDRMGFDAEVSQQESGRHSVSRFAYRFAGREFGMRARKDKGYSLYTDAADFKFRRTQGRPWPLPAPAKCYGFPDQVRAYYQNAGFLADFQLAFEDLFSHVYYLGPLREYPRRQYTWAGEQPADMGQRGEKVVDALLASRLKGEGISRGRGHKRFTVEEYVAHWLRELGLIHDFRVEAIAEGSNLYRVRVRRNASAAWVLLTDVGFGVSQILPVLAICYYVPEGSTILLEQPEIHLHPSVQSGLADVFIDAVEKRGVQIIVESHSEHFVRRLQTHVAKGRRTRPEHLALYFCTMPRGESVLTPLDIDLLGNIRNWPEDFFGDEFGEIAAMAKAQLEREGAGGD